MRCGTKKDYSNAPLVSPVVELEYKTSRRSSPKFAAMPNVAITIGRKNQRLNCHPEKLARRVDVRIAVVFLVSGFGPVTTVPNVSAGNVWKITTTAEPVARQVEYVPGLKPCFVRDTSAQVRCRLG